MAVKTEARQGGKKFTATTCKSLPAVGCHEAIIEISKQAWMNNPITGSVNVPLEEHDAVNLDLVFLQ